MRDFFHSPFFASRTISIHMKRRFSSTFCLPLRSAYKWETTIFIAFVSLSIENRTDEAHDLRQITQTFNAHDLKVFHSKKVVKKSAKLFLANNFLLLNTISFPLLRARFPHKNRVLVAVWQTPTIEWRCLVEFFAEHFRWQWKAFRNKKSMKFVCN